MISKIIVCLLWSGFVTFGVITLINILYKSNIKYVSLVLSGAFLFSIYESMKEIGVLYRVLTASNSGIKVYTIGTILICIIIFWLPSVLGMLYRKHKLSQMRIHSELDIIRIKDL